MNIPQIIVIILFGLSIGIDLAKHGQRKVGSYNLWHTLIATAIWVGLLIWGGFF
jgi:hypothetical protein